MDCRIDASYHVPGATFALLEAGNRRIAFRKKEIGGRALGKPLSEILLRVPEQDLVVANKSNGAIKGRG